VLTDFSTIEASVVLSSVSTAVARIGGVVLRREPAEEEAGLHEEEDLRAGKEREEVEESDDARFSGLRYTARARNA